MRTRYGARLLCLVLATVGFVRAPQTANQAPPRLVTRWAKEVRPDNVWPEYPRPQMVRPAWQNLNGLWHYAITARDATPAADAYRGTILVPFAVESFLSGARTAVTPDQYLWYRRTFKAPDRPAGGRVLLHFGAVDWEAARLRQRQAGRRASRRIRSVHVRHHRRAQARAASRRSSSASGTRPTRARSRAASRSSTREASGTPPSPASGRPCGSRPCRRRTSSACVSIRMSMRTRCASPWTAFGDGAAERHRTRRRPRRHARRRLATGRGWARRSRCRVPNAKLWSPASPFLYDLSVHLSDRRRREELLRHAQDRGRSRRQRRESAAAQWQARSSSSARSTRACGRTASTPRRPTRR